MFSNPFFFSFLNWAGRGLFVTLDGFETILTWFVAQHLPHPFWYPAKNPMKTFPLERSRLGVCP